LRKYIADPNIPDGNGITPLVAAIGNRRLPEELRVAMALRLLRNPWIDVDWRGPGGKRLLQIVHEAGLGPQLFDAIFRQGLRCFDVDVDCCAKYLMDHLKEQLDPKAHRQAVGGIQNFLKNNELDVNSFSLLPYDQLVNAIRRKINFLRNGLGIDFSTLHPPIVDLLNRAEANMQSYGEYLMQRN
jgi:hypothetical protein